MENNGKNIYNYNDSIFFFTLLPRSHLSASGCQPEAAAASTWKSWQQKESNFLPLTSVVFLRLYVKLPNTSQQDAAEKLDDLHATLWSSLKQRKQLQLLVMEKEIVRTCGWSRSSSGLIVPTHVMRL